MFFCLDVKSKKEQIPKKQPTYLIMSVSSQYPVRFIPV